MNFCVKRNFSKVAKPKLMHEYKTNKPEKPEIL